MANMIGTERSNIVAIADAVRNRTGESGDLTIGEIISGINGIEGGENLDSEIATQNTIIAEQDAKISELAEVLAGKAGGGGNMITADVLINDGQYGTTFRYVGINGLTEIGAPGKKNIQIVIPSICYIKSSNNGTSGFANYSVSGGCSTLFNNGYLAFVEITGDANIIAVSNAGAGG